MKIFIAHASAFAFEEKLYVPLRAFAKESGHEIMLPHENGDAWDSHNFIKTCDVFVIDASVHSTGAGIEAGWASAAGVPIIAIHEKGSQPSAVIPMIAPTILTYDGPEDMVAKLSTALAGLLVR